MQEGQRRRPLRALLAMAVHIAMDSGQSEPTRLQRFETYCGKLETASYELLARAERAEYRMMTAERALRQSYTALLKDDPAVAQQLVAQRLDEV